MQDLKRLLGRLTLGSTGSHAKFMKATDALSAYEKKYHFRETVAYTMAEAEAKDKSSSTILKRLKETLRPLKEGPTKIVDFLLHKSLPDKNPTIVKQVLSESSDTKEILWNFSRFKDARRLTLKVNPHFYKKLPTSAEKYEGQFRTFPVETFQQKISVLTDDPSLTGRLFLETAKEKRAFGNVWVPNEAIIFKDVCGKLEGENIIGSAIKDTPNLWCFEEPSLSNTSWPSLSDRSSPSPTTTATPTTSPTGDLLGDWRAPILRMLRSQGVKINIRILDKPPNSFSFGYSGPSLPSPLPDSCSIVGTLSPTPQSRPTLGIQIPGVSQGLLSPSSYKTARSTPLTQRTPAVELSPRSPAPLSQEPPIFPTPNVAPPTGPAVPDPLTYPLHNTSLSEVSRVDLIPSQTDTATILPMPTSTAAPLPGPAMPDPTICPPLDTSLREVSRVDPIPSQAGTAIIFHQPHVVELHADINEVEAPAIRPAFHFGRGVTTDVANDLASGLITLPQQQTLIVMTGHYLYAGISLVTEFTDSGLALSMVNFTTWSPAAILACDGYGWYVCNIPYRVCMTVACDTVKSEG